MFIGVMLFVCILCRSGTGDSFPSLLSTNASLAIVIDKEYLSEEYEAIKNRIEDYLIYAKREILRHGGVNVQFFAWSAINLKRDFTALLSITSCKDTWRLFRAAESESLLHLAISEEDCARLPQNQAVSIPIIRRGHETPQLLLDLRTTAVYKWKYMIIIHDDTISKDLLTRVIRSITKPANRIGASGISLMSLRDNSSESVDSIEANLKFKLSTINPKTVGGNFLAIVSYELVEQIMEYAKELKLVNTYNQWLYVVSDTNSTLKTIRRFKHMLKEGDNVAFIYNNTMVNQSTCTSGISCHVDEILTGFIKSLEEAIIEETEIASQVSEEEWEAIRPTKPERTNFLLNRVKKYLVDFGTCDNCTKWKLETGETWGKEYEVRDGKRNVADILSVGKWRPSDGPSMTDELFPHVAHGFRRKLLPFVSFHNPPWQILKTNASGDVMEYSGIVFDIINELSNNLNFTYSVEVVKSLNFPNTTTKSQGNGTDSFLSMIENSQISTFKVPQGILEMVHNKSVAMGACAFTVTEANKRIINFTSPISMQSYTFLVARPRELSRALLFISPFRSDTWLCISVLIISMGPILFYIHKLSPVYEYKGIRCKGGLSTVENCIWYMYGALLQQGGMHLPYADSARIIVGSWWLVVLVIGTTYCGNLVAYLTFPKVEVPITTLDDLIAHKDTISWSYARNTLFASQIQITDNPTYRMIHEYAKDISNKRAMIEEIRMGRHVYIDWKIKLQYMIKQQLLEHDACSFALGIDEFVDEQIALIVGPDTPYLNKINEEIKKLHQVGLIQKWLENYLPKKDKCWKKKRSVEVHNHTVNLDDMQGSFFVLFIGFFMSVLVIVVEKLWFKNVSHKKSKRVVQPFVT